MLYQHRQKPREHSFAAWQLGSGMSLAALAHDRGVAKGKVPAWFFPGADRRPSNWV